MHTRALAATIPTSSSGLQPGSAEHSSIRDSTLREPESRSWHPSTVLPLLLPGPLHPTLEDPSLLQRTLAILVLAVSFLHLQGDPQAYWAWAIWTWEQRSSPELGGIWQGAHPEVSASSHCDLARYPLAAILVQGLAEASVVVWGGATQTPRLALSFLSPPVCPLIPLRAATGGADPPC